MTVDPSLTQETDSFVCKNPKFFPTKIPILHWQLRHFISNPESDILYYASQHDVYSLNTVTGIRTHITVLPFWARCTAAGYGWICAGGGDGGHFAIIKLNPAGDVDARLPPEFGSRGSRPPPSVKIERLGTEIVNSISIHKLDGNEAAGVSEDVVAVLTNNDKTIRIFSLTQNTQNTVLDLPFPVNHATISPDGRMLVAVGDYQQAYFYERVDLKPSPDFKSQKHASAHCMWELLNIVLLHVPKAVHYTGYFTTAWSPSVRLCAVASECGYITILDIEALKSLDDGEDAVVAVIPSTRPETVSASGSTPGAVRTMTFAPHPWDLLIWSEDQGRVCLADLRGGLRVRQVLELEPDQAGLRHMEVEDHPANPYSRLDSDPEADYIRQFRRSHGIDNDSAFETEDAFLAAERRRMARSALRLADEEQLSTQERQVLDALRMPRQREESLSRSPAPRSIHYSELAAESRRTTAQQSSLFTQDFPALARQSEGTSASTSTLPATFRVVRDYIRDRSNPDSSDRPLYYSPRRQASIFISNDDADSAIGTSSTTSRHPPLPPNLRPSSTFFPDWASIADPSSDRATIALDDATRSRRPSPPPPGDHTLETNEFRRRRAIIRARERALSMRDAERYQRLASRGDVYDPSLGLRTAGLAVSWDGRRIWAACDKGIFEYELNVRERMMMPAVEMR